MGRPARGHQVLTEMRVRREVMGWTRQALAGRVDGLLPVTHGLTYEAVEEWELRERVPSPVYGRALCAQLGADHIADLGLGHSPEAAAWWCWATQSERKADVQRRTMRRSAVTVGGPALLPVPELVQEAQLFGRRPRVCRSVLDETRAVATRLVNTFIAEPAHPDLDRAAQAHAHTVIDLVRWACMAPKVRTELLVVAAEAAVLVGLVALDAGRLVEAKLWFGHGLKLAREADDAQLEAAMRVASSWLDSSTGSGTSGQASHRAVMTLQEGRARAGDVPKALRAWTHAYLSRNLRWVGDVPRIRERRRVRHTFG